MFRSLAVTANLLLALACSEGSNNSANAPPSAPPSAFHGNDNPAVPQAGILDLEFETATGLVITISGGGEQWSLTRPAATQFHEPVLGLKPNTKYTVLARPTSDEAVDPIGPFEWTTPPLPNDFPPLSVPVSHPALMEPGLIEFNPWVNAGKKIPLVIVDNSGVVRWYYDGYHAFDDHSRLPNGNFLFTPDECVLLEIDVLGNLVRSWYAARHPVGCKAVPVGSIPVEIESIHHQETLLPNGNLLVLSTEGRWIDDFPSSEDDPDAPRARAYVVGCVIVEFSPAGEVTQYVPLLDLLDPTRIGRNTVPAQQDKPPWGVVTDYSKQQGVPVNDWDHANGVIYDPNSDSYYVSLRHQDAVVKVDRSRASLVWILGNPANWKSPWKEKLLAPVGGLDWQYHQHSVELTAAGVGVYDNGNFRAAAFQPPTTPEYSRAVIYSVDEVSMTVQQTFSFGAPSGAESFFSPVMGSASWLPTTGNELVASGHLASKNQDRIFAQILEVAPDGTRLFELNVGGSSANTWYLLHRARRIADLRE